MGTKRLCFFCENSSEEEHHFAKMGVVGSNPIFRTGLVGALEVDLTFRLVEFITRWSGGESGQDTSQHIVVRYGNNNNTIHMQVRLLSRPQLLFHVLIYL